MALPGRTRELTLRSLVLSKKQRNEVKREKISKPHHTSRKRKIFLKKPSLFSVGGW